MFDMGFDHIRSGFSMTYKCYSHLLTPGKSRDDLMDGGKILLPQSALEYLTRMNTTNPMTFKLTNSATNKSLHCGVLEFVADEGNIHVPYWMMQNLNLEEGDPVHVKSVVLPTATFARFQPQSVSFLDIYDPKAVLEFALRKFACLSVGDVIPITYNDNQYDLKVLELKPNKAVQIIECDMSVDFAPPVGYVENSKPKLSVPASDDTNESLIPDHAKGMRVFGGTGIRLDGRVVEVGSTAAPKDSYVISERGKPNYDYKPGSLTFLRVTKKHEVENASSFKPFVGKGIKLKGEH
nr:ubiquitin fusion degradation protein 1 [Hymenolepis microstoma]